MFFILLQGFLVIFVNSSFVLLSYFIWTVQSFPVRVITCDLSGITDACIRRCWFCCVPCCLEHLVVWLQRGDVQTDARSSEDKDISAQSGSDTEGVTDTDCTQWTDNTNC
jgi:hypothetical protein